MVSNNQQNGFTVIEAVVGLTVLSIAFLGFLSLIKFNFSIQSQSGKKIEAVDLSAEAIEIIRGIKNANWSNISSLSIATNYYLTTADGAWQLITDNPGLINDLFTRRITFENVYRDADDNISISGTTDINTKKVEVFVEWTDRGKAQKISLITYLTSWNE